VPEIYNGTVEIKSIAREAGHRSKVAVAALQEGVDPVGSCVGMRGTRIQNIVNELNGEKIDVVQWNPDLSYFIANSLSPAKVMNVMLNDDSGKTAAVVVPDKQLSLAIGKEGQNARLAAKLTGWRIDIKSASEAAEESIEKVRTQPAIRERMSTEKLNLFNLAASILHEKPAAELSDGELNLLSEAIEAVNLAQMAVERERREAAEAARREARSRDILAEAEAILTGGQPIVPLEEEEEAEAEIIAEAEAVVEEVSAAAAAVEVEPLEAEAEAAGVAQAADDILAEAEALLAGQVEVEAEVLEVEEAVGEPVEEEAEAELVEVELKPVPELEPSLLRSPDWPEEAEEFDPDEDKRLKELEKKKAKQKRRRLVFDERLGEVIAERRRKRSRQGDDWLDYESENEE
jgi:N utilization substance protein A